MKQKIKLGLDVNRRDFIKFGSLSVAGLALNRLFQPGLSAQEVLKQNAAPRAKAVIQIFLAGGPCHIDTFDPKPEAAREFVGAYKSYSSTNVDGIIIGEKLPLMAKCADKYSIVRGMTHGDNSHEVSTYMMLSGVPAGGELVYPSMGSVIAYERRNLPQAQVPPFISVMDPYSRFDEAGFIGDKGRSFSASGIISRDELDFKMPSANEDPKKKVRKKTSTDASEFSNRKELLEALDNLHEDITEEMKEADPQRQLAYSMIVGKGKEAFDLSKESDKTRESYGAVRYFGQQLLLARRLVEAGASYVNVMLHGWDTHKKHFEAMDILLPALDQAYAALIEDLDQRGLLDTTIVTLGGEFGRTPKVMYNAPWMGGRNHFGPAFSWVLAGGGFKGGCLVGKTNATGEKVTERPVYPWDLSSSIYKLAGVDTSSKLPHPTGCVAYVIPPEVLRRTSGGMLNEIMKV